MELTELFEKRKLNVTNLEALVSEKREYTSEETETFNRLELEIKNIDSEIELKNNNKINNKKNMENFGELIVRTGANVENFSVRAVQLTSGIDDVQVAANISSVGYVPFYKSMGCEVLPNLTTSIKLPFVNGVQGQKKAEGQRSDNDKTLATILLQPSRFTITETIGKEILAIGNQAALQAYLLKMVEGCDKAITKEVFDVVVAGATGAQIIAGITGGYTTANMDKLAVAVDGNYTFLMPRSEFFKGKGVNLGASGKFLAEKTNQFAGNMWDGSPLFYSNLFAGTSIAVADLANITIGEFGDQYEVIFDNFSKAPEGQVVITVCKLAGVVLRNTMAVAKAVIGA